MPSATGRGRSGSTPQGFTPRALYQGRYTLAHQFTPEGALAAILPEAEVLISKGFLSAEGPKSHLRWAQVPHQRLWRAS